MRVEKYRIPVSRAELLGKWKEAATGKRMPIVNNSLNQVHEDRIKGPAHLMLDGIADEKGFRGFIYDWRENTVMQKYRPYGPVTMEPKDDRGEECCSVMVTYHFFDLFETIMTAVVVLVGMTVLRVSLPFTGLLDTSAGQQIWPVLMGIIAAFIACYLCGLYFRFRRGRRAIPRLLEQYYGAEPVEWNGFEPE